MRVPGRLMKLTVHHNSCVLLEHLAQHALRNDDIFLRFVHVQAHQTAERSTSMVHVLQPPQLGCSICEDVHGFDVIPSRRAPKTETFQATPQLRLFVSEDPDHFQSGQRCKPYTEVMPSKHHSHHHKPP